MSLVIGISYLQVSLRGSSCLVILGAFIIQFISILISLYLVGGSSKDFISTTLLLLMSSFTLYEFEKQLYGNFLAGIEQEHLILKSLTISNEKRLAELQTKEIQFLVANTGEY